MRTMLRQGLIQRLFLPVVDRCIKPQFLRDPPTLLLAPRDPNHAAARNPCKLSNEGAGRAGGPGHNESLSLSWLGDVKQAEICSDTDMAAQAEIHSQRDVGILGQRCDQIVRADDSIVLPAE